MSEFRERLDRMAAANHVFVQAGNKLASPTLPLAARITIAGERMNAAATLSEAVTDVVNYLHTARAGLHKAIDHVPARKKK